MEYVEYKKALLILKGYYEEASDFTKDFINNEIAYIGKDAYFEYAFRQIDCTRITKDGMRLMQTIGVDYRSNITELLYAIEVYGDNKPELYEKLIDIHNKNIEYEKINPPIIYDTKKSKIKTKKESKTKTKNVDKVKEKKPSDKLISHAMSLAGFKLTIK